MYLRLILALFLVALPACDGGTEPDGDGNGNGNGGPPTEFFGFFIDDAVEGLQYQVGAGPIQTTDKYGTFKFTLDDGLAFFVDGISIGGASEGLTRITPSNLGVTGENVARFLQSLDTSPGTPGIDLTGLDLADTPINFTQGRSEFGADPAVLAAVAVAQAAGGTGVLVSAQDALTELAAGTATVLVANDLLNVAFFPVTPGINEPCFARFRDDGTAQSICRDDILTDPSDPAEEFTWSIQNSLAVLELRVGGVVEERVTLQQLGTTANRISVQVSSELLNCNPNVEPCIEGGVQTLVTALPIAAADFNGLTLALAGSGGTRTATFNANGTGSWSEGGTTQDFTWAVDAVFPDVLVLRGTGAPGSQMLYHELILLEGTPANGSFAALLAEATDMDSSGDVDDTEAANTRLYEAVEELTSTGG